MAYHLKKKITVDNTRDEKPDYLKWRKQHYLVRSDGGGMSTRTDTCDTLTDARKLAKSLARDAQPGAIVTCADMRYSIYVKYTNNTGTYLSHHGRTEWALRTARRHLRDVVREHIEGNDKWAGVRYFALVAA